MVVVTLSTYLFKKYMKKLEDEKYALVQVIK